MCGYNTYYIELFITTYNITTYMYITSQIDQVLLFLFSEDVDVCREVLQRLRVLAEM